MSPTIPPKTPLILQRKNHRQRLLSRLLLRLTSNCTSKTAARWTSDFDDEEVLNINDAPTKTLFHQRRPEKRCDTWLSYVSIRCRRQCDSARFGVATRLPHVRPLERNLRGGIFLRVFDRTEIPLAKLQICSILKTTKKS